jgi:hypothetical protein
VAAVVVDTQDLVLLVDLGAVDVVLETMELPPELLPEWQQLVLGEVEELLLLVPMLDQVDLVYALLDTKLVRLNLVEPQKQLVALLLSLAEILYTRSTRVERLLLQIRH